MGIGVLNKNITEKISNNLEKARNDHIDSMEKLSSGEIFTKRNPQPATKALADKMEFKLRSLATSKQNISEGISLLQTAESGLSEINNIIVRMKELNVAAATTTVTNKERRYMLIEYEALHDEMNRIAKTTEYNGIPLLNGNSDKSPEELILRIDDPAVDEDGSYDENDINTIRFDGLKNIVATPEGLGLRSIKDLLSDSSYEEGIALEDIEDLMTPQEDNGFPTIYDEAINALTTQRAIFGAMQSRLNRSSEYLDVYQENIAAAKSNIADTDYAKEVVKMAQSNILMQAATGLLAQSNLDAGLTLNLLSSVIK